MNQKVRRMWARAKAVALAAGLVLGFATEAKAQDNDGKVTFSVCALNVDGLPNSIAGIEINPDGKGEEGATAIGNYLNEKAYDVLALSEDFNYHSSLVSPLAASYKVGTYRGGLSMSGFNTNIRFNTDGLEFLTRTPIVFGSESWTPWKANYGKFDNGADELITKGFRRYTVSIGEGLLVDFYILHMDAGSTDADNAARAQQWEQLRDDILAHNTGHPIIVMGDTNSRYTRDDISGLFVTPLSDSYDVNDVWVEKCLNGEAPTLGSASLMVDELGYERGEIVDKVFYLNPKNGSVRLTASTMNIDADCVLSDHKPFSVVFEATGKPYAPAESSAWWRGEEWTGNGQEVYLYNVGRKYFISNDFAPTATSISQAAKWNIWGGDEFTISNDTHRLQMKSTKAQQGVISGSGATTFNNHEAGNTAGSHRIGLKDRWTFWDAKTHFFGITTSNGAAAYTATTTKNEDTDWLLISPKQKEAYERYNQLYQTATSYLNNAALNLPTEVEQQLTTALDATSASNYTTCQADTTTLLAACEAVEKWLARDIDIDASRMTTVSLPWNAKIPEGVSVYYATEYLSDVTPNSVHIVKYEGSVLPANTGFIIFANDDNDASSLHFAYTTEAAETPSDNILKAAVDGIGNADLSFDKFTYMTLGTNNGVKGFSALNNDASIAANSAYIQLDAVNDGETTAPSFAVFDYNYETAGMDINIGDTRMTTICLPQNAKVPAGITLYYASEYISEMTPAAVHLVKYEGTVVPARTGFVVFADDDNDATSLHFAYTNAQAEQVTSDILEGTLNEIAAADLSHDTFTYYTVGTSEAGKGFYTLNDDESIPANSAYMMLRNDSETGEKAPEYVLFDFNNETLHIDIAIGETRVATVCAPFNVTIPEGISVYYATELLRNRDNDALHLMKYEGDVLPANTGFVVFANADNDATSICFRHTDDDATLPIGNILKGTVCTLDGGSLSFTDNTYMTLGTDGTVNGFCALAEGSSIPAYAAYLQLPIDTESGKEMPTFARFDFDFETAVLPIANTGDATAKAIYGINGAKKNNLTRGINIVKTADGTVRKLIVR